MILAHFGAMLLVVLLAKSHFTFDQCVDLVFILAPLFSAFTLAVIADFVKRRHSTAKGKRVNGAFLFITLFFPLVYALAVFGFISAWPLGWIDRIDQLKRSLAATETLLSASLGLVFGALFEFKTSKKDV